MAVLRVGGTFDQRRNGRGTHPIVQACTRERLPPRRRPARGASEWLLQRPERLQYPLEAVERDPLWIIHENGNEHVVLDPHPRSATAARGTAASARRGGTASRPHSIRTARPRRSRGPPMPYRLLADRAPRGADPNLFFLAGGGDVSASRQSARTCERFIRGAGVTSLLVSVGDGRDGPTTADRARLPARPPYAPGSDATLTVAE